MTTLTILEMLYIALILFVAVIGTLLSIVLIRLIKILGPLNEIVETYNKVRSVIDLYASIPGTIIDWFKDSFGSIIKKR